jgi:hypothetical protein
MSVSPCFPVVNEACRCLAEGVVVRASDLDVAAVLGKPAPLSHHSKVSKVSVSVVHKDKGVSTRLWFT